MFRSLGWCALLIILGQSARPLSASARGSEVSQSLQFQGFSRPPSGAHRPLALHGAVPGTFLRPHIACHRTGIASNPYIIAPALHIENCRERDGIKEEYLMKCVLGSRRCFRFKGMYTLDMKAWSEKLAKGCFFMKIGYQEMRLLVGWQEVVKGSVGHRKNIWILIKTKWYGVNLIT